MEEGNPPEQARSAVAPPSNCSRCFSWRRTPCTQLGSWWPLSLPPLSAVSPTPAPPFSPASSVWSGSRGIRLGSWPPRAPPRPGECLPVARGGLPVPFVSLVSSPQHSRSGCCDCRYLLLCCWRPGEEGRLPAACWI